MLSKQSLDAPWVWISAYRVGVDIHTPPWTFSAASQPSRVLPLSTWGPQRESCFLKCTHLTHNIPGEICTFGKYNFLFFLSKDKLQFVWVILFSLLAAAAYRLCWGDAFTSRISASGSNLLCKNLPPPLRRLELYMDFIGQAIVCRILHIIACGMKAVMVRCWDCTEEREEKERKIPMIKWIESKTYRRTAHDWVVYS